METTYKICKSFSEFQEDLKNHEKCTYSKYVVVRSEKKFSIPEVIIHDKKKVYWHDDTPYLKVGIRIYACHRGKDTNLYQKKKYAEDRDNKALNDHTFTKRYNQMKPSKKLDCPASFTVTRILRILDQKVRASRVTKQVRNRISKAIKKKISDRELVGEDCFIYNLPKKENHKFHQMETAGSNDQNGRIKHLSNVLERGKSNNETVISKPTDMFVDTDLPGDEENTHINCFDSSVLGDVAATVEVVAGTLEEEGIPSVSEEHGQLKPSECNRQVLIDQCNASLRNLQNIFWYLDEENVANLSTALKEIVNEFSGKVPSDNRSIHPLELSCENIQIRTEEFCHQNKEQNRNVSFVS
uniref:Uncharacterized protein n=1 Tax=Cuerna arida TaxID=1464854 RepID=A0A1B6FX03_9HEMI